MSIFVLERCAFLFFVLSFSIVTSQIYISGEAHLIGNENVYYTDQSGNFQNAGDSLNQPKISEHGDSEKFQSLQYGKKLPKKLHKKEQSLVSKQELLEKKIKNRPAHNSGNKIECNLLPNGKSALDFFVKQRNSKTFIFQDTENHFFVQNARFQYQGFVFDIINSRIIDFYYSIYRDGKEFIYSVRPPPFLSV